MLRRGPATLSAAILTAMIATGANAEVHTGILEGDQFSAFLPAPPPFGDTRPLRISLDVDLSKFESYFLSIGILAGFVGTFDNGPGQPRTEYGDSFDIWDEYTGPVTATGFSTIIDTADNATCNPYRGPDYFCEYEYLIGFYIDGTGASEPTPYTYRITVVPEPATWALIGLGFGALGGALRRRRALDRAALA